MSGAPSSANEPEIVGARWRDAIAELEYAERHGASPSEMERLAAEVIEARVEMFQAGVRGGWQLPRFLQAALERDRRLLEAWPAPAPELPEGLPDDAERGPGGSSSSSGIG